MLLDRPIAHLGFAVPDIEAAAERWVKSVGAGPFCRVGGSPLRLRDVIHAGQPATWSHTTATGQWGDLLLELFESHSAEPDSLAAGMGVGEYGLHHVGWFAGDVAAESSRLEELGAPLIVAAGVNEQDFVFHDARHLIGARVEVYEELPRVGEHYRLVRAAAAGWDGEGDVLMPLGAFRERFEHLVPSST
ncbi:MAG: VOC family protein [Solirubrobacterales bacterium]